MARKNLRKKALKLRQQGKSYGQIMDEIVVSKSTLSRWLREYPLSKKQLKKLSTSEKRIENYRETMRRKREARVREIYRIEKEELLPLSSRELFVAGLFLYWGEGVKGVYNTHISLSNTNPQLIKFFSHWLINSLSVPKGKLRVNLHLYKDMDIEEEKKYWSRKLDIPINQFTKPYIKEGEIDGVFHNGFRHGTCSLAVYDARLKERIMMAIKAVSTQTSGKF